MQARSAHAEHSSLFAMVRALLLFFILTVWCYMLSIAYAYAGDYGLVGWLRLPEGLEPLRRLNLTIADVGALAALFVAILIASTVQLNAVVQTADSIAEEEPTTQAEADDRQHRLQFAANQAEMSMVVSFGATFSVLMITVLFGLSEVAENVSASVVDTHGIGWSGAIEASQELTHPRFVIMYVVSLLLYLTTYSSMPEWKNTGLFRSSVEASAFAASKRLEEVAERHSLDNVDEIKHPRQALLATVAGYAIYVSVFALMLNVSLSVIVGGQRFDGFFSAGHGVLFFVFCALAMLVSTAVGSVMLYVHHLHAGKNILVVASIILGIVGLLYVMSGEGAAWAIAVAVVVVAYAIFWSFLYWKSAEVLDGDHPGMLDYFLMPPKFIIVRRYEAIRRSAARLEELKVVPSQKEG